MSDFERELLQLLIAVGQWLRETHVLKTLSCWGKSFKCQLHTTHVGAVGREPYGSTQGRRILGLLYVYPLL